jgi:adenylylsulfate kinase
MPFNANRGGVIWLTGLSGAGKTTIARAAQQELLRQGIAAEVLDGDTIRETFSRGLGYSKADRDENVRRTGCVAKLLASHGVVVLVALISPYRAAREEVREEVERAGIPFLEVYVNAPLEVCEERDPKGLYHKARRGEIPSFTGVDDPYEAPVSPDRECRTDRESAQIAANRILMAYERKNDRLRPFRLPA